MAGEGVEVAAAGVTVPELALSAPPGLSLSQSRRPDPALNAEGEKTRKTLSGRLS